MESVKIPFPTLSPGAQLSIEEFQELQDAIFQMELWNSLVFISTPKHNVAFIKRALKEFSKTPNKISSKITISVDDNRKKSSVVSEIVTDFGINLRSTKNIKFVEPLNKVARNPEKSSFEHGFRWDMDPYYNLKQKFSVCKDTPPTFTLASRLPSDEVFQSLRPAKKERFPFFEIKKPPKPRQLVTPKKEDPDKPSFKVRRKPVPRLSDLPSSPIPVSRELENWTGNQIINSFPALDSGSMGHYYQLDPEVLESPGPMRIRNLNVKKLLGTGGQGRVYLAQGPPKKSEELEPVTGSMFFAVKIIIKNRHVHYDDILREQKLLRRLRGNRFLLQLEASFHDNKNFYLITEYHAGGDLDDLLRDYGYFSASAARIYTAELCAAVGFLHEHYILHRDIKPSNILIKSDGHICLGDFGLAIDFLESSIDDDKRSFVVNAGPLIRGCAGTTMYMAPEALKGDYYGFKADWWSVGATCYNLFEGIHPWPSFEYGWLIEFAGVEPVRFRVTTDSHVRSFVRALLDRNQDQRLGGHELFSHPFFNGLKVQDIFNGRLVPPHIPKAPDITHISTTLTRNDIIEVGGHYREGAVPMADYIFYGPNLPEYTPSADEVDTNDRPDLPFACSPSLSELLGMSFDAVESATLNGFGDMFAPPGHLDVISGPTIVEEFRLDNGAGAAPREAAVRKDSGFCWSMLSTDQSKLDSVADDQEIQTIPPIGLEVVEVNIGTASQGTQDRGTSPNSTVELGLASVPMPITVMEVFGHHQKHKKQLEDIKQVQATQSDSMLKHQCEPPDAIPVMPTTTLIASPSYRTVIHREAKLVQVYSNDSPTKSHVRADSLTLLSPISGYNYKNDSVCETVAFSSLELGLGDEGNETGSTTFDSIFVLPGVSSSVELAKGPGIYPIGRPQNDAAAAEASAFDSGVSVLGKLENHMASLPLPQNGDNFKDFNGRDVNVRSGKLSRDAGVVGVTILTECKADVVSTQEQGRGRSYESRDRLGPCEHFVGTITSLVCRIVQAISRGVTELLSKACKWKLVKA